ncbi:MAG: O-antigen ligase family protein [Gammaproteobacteria bacterium]
MSIARLATRGATITIDVPITVLIGAFIVWAGISSLWSVDPSQSLRGTLQFSAISTISIALIVLGRIEEQWKTLVFAVSATSLLVGSLVGLMDMLANYRVHEIITPFIEQWSPTKYNRGLNYLLLLIWPLALWVRHNFGRWRAAVVAAPIAAMSILSLSATARVEMVAGGLIFILAHRAPKWIATILSAITVSAVLLVPALVQLVSQKRSDIAPFLKKSGLHRMEIWDYMSARIFERPFAGWGFSTAKSVPITNQELSQYTFATDAGIYPHNQWIELWLGSGIVGVAIGLATALVVLHRIAQLSSGSRPYAYAAFASALVVSSVNFELTTDSWWAALAATAFLFKATENTDEAAFATRKPFLTTMPQP